MPLATTEAGFTDQVGDAQHCFRAAMHALSRPGLLVPLPVTVPSIDAVSSSAAALMLALLDQDTCVYLSPSRAQGGLGSWLRFHTDCRLVASPADAHFALIGAPAEMPDLTRFNGGDDHAPHTSATLIVEAPLIDPDGGWRLTGPGIAGHARLSIPGIGADFSSQWMRQHARFPCGVDILFASRGAIVGLPRTTRIEL